MHEASLAGSVLQLVEAAARRDGFRRVAMLRLEAGQLSGVEPRALRFALEALAPGPPCRGLFLALPGMATGPPADGTALLRAGRFLYGQAGLRR
ncbi:MAG: hydrogenase maturation nickel metallochaperone HypA, partial [Burkholderiales bacterium]|nr:hydrogenase maturation nickel metallochaperone HypA [Burkholderiales bacterium]